MYWLISYPSKHDISKPSHRSERPLTETIRGDEFMGGDDVLFGGLCAHTACKVMEFSDFVGSPRRVEIRLRWMDATHQLALYKTAGDPAVVLKLTGCVAATFKGAPEGASTRMFDISRR